MKIEGSKVFVTGGCGHIASHIVDELFAKNVGQVVVYDNLASGRVSSLQDHLKDSRLKIVKKDIRDYEDVLESMSGCDYVFHTAGILLLECRKLPRKGLDVNITGTYNVVKAAAENGIKKLVFSSSGSVYGDPSYIPMDEEHPYNSETLYGTTKIAGEHLLRDFYRSNKLNYVSLRYFNVYGPRQHYSGAYTQIIPRWFDLIQANKSITINGDGSQTMDMTYVTDVAKANILALESDVNNDSINVGTGKSWSILDIVGIMENVVGHKLPVEFIKEDVNLVKQRQCDTEKAEKLINFKYQVEAPEGIKKYWEWRINNDIATPRD